MRRRCIERVLLHVSVDSRRDAMMSEYHNGNGKPAAVMMATYDNRVSDDELNMQRLGGLANDGYMPSALHS